jgi:hypothetical protein
MNRKVITLCGLLIVLLLQPPPVGAGEKKDSAPAETTSQAVLWRDPLDITERDLFYGPGGKDHAPNGTFTFIKEDLNGTNPKFDVVDEKGMKWKVKLGLEARPESLASRIVWAVGYSTNEDYFVPEITVHGMPAHLHRGQKLVNADGSMHSVRLKRDPKGDKKIGIWSWRDDPFVGTRELSGLKVMMALLNNWDLKDENNAVYTEDGERVYLVSDLGASLGSAGRAWPRANAKDNLDSYRHSRFIRKVTSGFVDFEVPARPAIIYVFSFKEYIERVRLESIGRHVPREDVRWISHLLSRLSTDQIQDAFRASGYSAQETEQFSDILKQRIAALTAL